MREITGEADPDQLLLFKLGKPKRRPPTRAEVDRALPYAVKLAIWKHHRGRPPKGMTFDDLHQEVSKRTLKRICRFRHGGAKRFDEFCYMAAYYSLIDIYRKHRQPMSEDSNFTPLLDAV